MNHNKETGAGTMGSSPLPSSGQGTFLGEIRFLGTMAWLLVCLFADFIFNVSCLIGFQFLRGPVRRRIRRTMFHADASPSGRGSASGGANRGNAGLLGLAVLALLAPGCWTLRVQEPDPPAVQGAPGSFPRQIAELRWTSRVLLDESDGPKSLRTDVKSLLFEPEWRHNLKFSVRNLFVMDGNLKSMASDLKNLAEPDAFKHGLWESLRMVGW